MSSTGFEKGLKGEMGRAQCAVVKTQTCKLSSMRQRRERGCSVVQPGNANVSPLCFLAVLVMSFVYLCICLFSKDRVSLHLLKVYKSVSLTLSQSACNKLL